MPAKKTTSKKGATKKGAKKKKDIKESVVQDYPKKKTRSSGGGFGQFILTVLITGLIVVVAVAIYAKFTDKEEEVVEIQEKVVEETQEKDEGLIGGQKDENGCLTPAGYSWCETQQKCLRSWEEWCEDEAFKLVDGVDKQIKIKLEPKGPVKFDWRVEGEEKIETFKLEGQKFAIEGIKDNQLEQIIKYLNHNFESDIYNVADGVGAGLSGYMRGSMACILSFDSAEMNENEEGLMVPVPDNKNVELKCGFLDRSELPELSYEKLIRNALAKKYSKKVSEVDIKISKEADSHVRGAVTFAPGDTENSGMFLAVKQGEDWKIVFDGNGSYACEDIEQYSFPEEMVEDCFEEEEDAE